jgi:hypothetical protein
MSDNINTLKLPRDPVPDPKPEPIDPLPPPPQPAILPDPSDEEITPEAGLRGLAARESLR